MITPSLSTARHTALALDSFLLGAWEASRLLAQDEHSEEGKCKMIRLRRRLQSISDPVAADSMRACGVTVSPAIYQNLLTLIEQNPSNALKGMPALVKSQTNQLRSLLYVA